MDRGGTRYNDAFYELPVIPVRKPLNRIVAKKRSMYRKRYNLLARLEDKIKNGLASFGTRVHHKPHFSESNIRYGKVLRQSNRNHLYTKQK